MKQYKQVYMHSDSCPPLNKWAKEGWSLIQTVTWSIRSYGGCVPTFWTKYILEREGVSLSDVWACIDAGNFIDAIKTYRGLFGCGLKEAKDAIEALPDFQRRLAVGKLPK